MNKLWKLLKPTLEKIVLTGVICLMLWIVSFLEIIYTSKDIELQFKISNFINKIFISYPAIAYLLSCKLMTIGPFENWKIVTLKARLILAFAILMFIIVTTLTIISDKSEPICSLIGGKYLSEFCYDCFLGCDSFLTSLLRFIQRGGRLSILG